MYENTLTRVLYFMARRRKKEDGNKPQDENIMVCPIP